MSHVMSDRSCLWLLLDGDGNPLVRKFCQLILDILWIASAREGEAFLRLSPCRGTLFCMAGDGAARCLRMIE